jgi:hypothetical protein
MLGLECMLGFRTINVTGYWPMRHIGWREFSTSFIRTESCVRASVSALKGTQHLRLHALVFDFLCMDFLTLALYTVVLGGLLAIYTKIVLQPLIRLLV